MNTEVQNAVANGAKVQEQVFEQLCERVAETAEKLNVLSANILHDLAKDILKALLAAHSVIYGRGLHSRLDLSQPINAICWQAAGLLQLEEVSFDGAIFSAQRTYESVGTLFDLLIVPQKDSRRLVEAAVTFGRADVLMTHAVTGIWDIMAVAHDNAMLADKLAEARKTGGDTQSKINKMQASIWKAKALGYALKVEAKRPKSLTRDGMATEIKLQFDDEVPGLRAIADWLEKEAEKPNGPLRSRARKKPI